MEFYLADRLGMTVAALRRDMSPREYIYWSVYHGRRRQREELEQIKQQSRAKRGRVGGR